MKRRAVLLLAAVGGAAGAQVNHPAATAPLPDPPSGISYSDRLAYPDVIVPGRAPGPTQIALADPVVLESRIEAHPLAVQAGATLASETLLFGPKHYLTEGRLTVSTPIAFDLPADTDLVEETGERGREFCVFHQGAFEPATDAAGNIYPAQCLVSAGRDGRLTILRFIPYDLQRAGIIDVPIEPVIVRPRPLSAASRLGTSEALHRLIVTKVDAATATVASQTAFVMAGDDRPAEYRPDGDDRRIPLVSGSIARIDGVVLSVSRSDAGWTIAAAGAFLPWIKTASGSFRRGGAGDGGEPPQGS